jgi:site-specific DNA recombinase
MRGTVDTVKQENLLNAVENGTIGHDETIQRRDHSRPAVEHIKASQVDVFGKVLREKLLAKGSPLAKSYLNILVEEIVVQDKTATVRGSYEALAETMRQIKKGNLNQVPSFMVDWCARSDSNARPLGS